MRDDLETLPTAAGHQAVPLMSDDTEPLEAVTLIQERGGTVRTVRTEAGALIMAGVNRLNGLIVADLINLKRILPDGPHDYRILNLPEGW